jgi:hypothetical protein
MDASSPDDPPPSAWSSLGPVEQAREWEEFRPGTFDQVFDLARHDADYRRATIEAETEHRRRSAEAEAQHERRLDYIAVIVQLMTPTFALAAVAIMAWTAKYYADHNAAADGVKIFGVGAGSIVAAFLGVNASSIGKRLQSRSRQNKHVWANTGNPSRPSGKTRDKEAKARD